MIPQDSSEYRAYVIRRAVAMSKLFSLKANPAKIDDMILKFRLKPFQIRFYKEAWAILEELYPGNGDIHFELQPTFRHHTNSYGSNHARDFFLFKKFEIHKMYIVVRFPLIPITNSKNYKHIIRDLFIRMPVDLMVHPARLTFDTIQGSRATVTTAEAVSGYRHSHLGSYSFLGPEDQCDYGNFCTGSGQDIDINRMVLNTGYDANMFRLMLMQFKTFAEWESIEGTPYKRLEEIALKDTRYDAISSSALLRSYLNRIIGEHIARGRDIDINWKLSRGVYSIVNDEKFDDMLRVLEETDPSIYYFRDTDGSWYKKARVSPQLLAPTTTWMPFRGERIVFKVIPLPEQEDESIVRKQFINQSIKDYVRTELEAKANIIKTRQVGIDKLNSLAYT